MKNAILPTICILLCTLCLIFVPTEAEASIYEDTVRLHILAPSDSAEDQNLKLEVRDMILGRYGDRFAKARNASDARRAVAALIPTIEEDCKQLILDTGYHYSVKAELTEEWFNTREYGSFSLPSGSYTSLTVTLGEGEGQNWWCVMYPPLCLDAALSDTGTPYSDSELTLITSGGYRVKFKLLEVAAAVFEDQNKKFSKKG